MQILVATEKFEFLSMDRWSHFVNAVQDSLNLLQLEETFRAVVVQKNDCPCILLTGLGLVSCLTIVRGASKE